ncbi:hypothetical protein A2U01_0118078, partial [Trifolium medium]|nr:hypothetical protein [Trifolium medium]
GPQECNLQESEEGGRKGVCVKWRGCGSDGQSH